MWHVDKCSFSEDVSNAEGWWNEKDKHPVVRMLQELLLLKADEACTSANVQMFELLGRLAEHPSIRAHLAAAYIAVGTNKLVPVALHNHGSETRETLEINGPGIVPRAALEKKTIYVPDVTLDDEYLEISTKTRSELAIPVIWDSKLIGVINLESRSTNGFNDRAREKAKSAIPELLLEFLVLWNRCDKKSWFPWHPRIHGWDIENLVTEMLAAASNTVSDATVSFTLWYADWENRIASVYATSGYDWEYKSKGLSIDDSEIGRGLLEGEPVTELKISNFVEHEKAEAMGVEEAYLATIGASFNESFQPTAGLTCYLRSQGETVNSLEANDRELAVSSLHGLAILFGNLIERYRASRLSLAIAHANAINAANSMSGNQTRMEQWLAGLLTIFNSPAGSVFLLDDSRKLLRCIATTGFYEFKSSTRSFELKSHTYDVAARAKSHTVSAFRNTGIAIRQNELGKSLSRYEPQTASAEFIAGEPLRKPSCSSRKILLCGISNEGDIVGVVRLVRGAEHRLFTQYEANLLERLCSQWAPATEVLETRPIEAPIAMDAIECL